MDRFAELKVFAMIAEAGDFSRAARAAGLTPSGVSKLVLRLETRLGGLLFNRSSRRVELTPEGERFYAKACEILASLEEAEAAVGDLRTTVSGSLRVYVMPAFARLELAPVLPVFLDRHPELRVEILLGNEPLQALEGGIDVAIQGGRLLDSSLTQRKVANTTWVVCASPAYLETHGVPAHPDELNGHQCLDFVVGGDRWNTWRFVDPAGRQLSFEAKGRLPSNNSDMLMAAAVAGCGIARLTEYQVRSEISAGRLTPLLPDFTPTPEQEIYALYHTRRHVGPRARLFVDFLVDQFGKTCAREQLRDECRPRSSPSR